MASKKPTIDYVSLKADLDVVMAELQREDLDVDIALTQYERGLELVAQLEKYLITAENRVTELKARFSA